MPHRDRAVILAFVVVLTILAAGILLPVAAPLPGPGASPSPVPSAAIVSFRDGIVGRPSSINPLTTRTRADRDLVALIFRGLTRLGPGQALVGDLAESWTIADGGKTYTFRLRDGVAWHDGTPVTAADVAFTIGLLKDSAYTGPAGASWADVTVHAVDDRTIRFTLRNAIGGFLQAATQPILPEHLLHGVRVTELADAPFSRDPVGNGPYRIAERDFDRAILEAMPGYVGAAGLTASPGPAVTATPAAAGSPLMSPAVPAGSAAATPPGTPGVSPSGTESAAPSASLAPSGTPGGSIDLTVPVLPRIELRFYGDEQSLAAAFRQGALDAASGLTPATAQELATVPGVRLLRYPSAIFTSVTLNLRPDHPRFRDKRFRRALVEAVDRQALIVDVLGGAGAIAATPIPPSSWAFSANASPVLPFDRKAAAAELKKAGWRKTAPGWVPPGGSKPLSLELLSIDKATNPLAYSIAVGVAQAWTSFGIRTKVVGFAPSVLVARLRAHKFDAALLDVNIGLDPDLYPILGSTQVGPNGSNISGIQSTDLDALLKEARRPGATALRRKRYALLQRHLADEQYLPPLLFRDYIVAYRDTVAGPAPRELGDLSDRYWDVLTWRLATGR